MQFYDAYVPIFDETLSIVTFCTVPSVNVALTRHNLFQRLLIYVRVGKFDIGKSAHFLIIANIKLWAHSSSSYIVFRFKAQEFSSKNNFDTH